MAGYLTTHVLDTARGCPAAGLKIELYKIISNSSEFLSEAVTKSPGPLADTCKFSISPNRRWQDR